MAKIFIGTSGYIYEHWRGIFYPAELPQSKWFEYYSKFFSTVELNNTFYHLPKESTFKLWEKQAPKSFTYAVKASRFITHIKKLKECKEPVKLFLSRAKLLKGKLGPILFQLPPGWKCNKERFQGFLKLLPKNFNFVFEFRNPTWFDEDIYEMLKKYNIGFCIFDMPNIKCPDVVTSKIVYIRMHGGSILYGSNYSDTELRKLAEKIKNYSKTGKEVYIYFNNDAYAFAVKNALSLKELLS